MAGDLKNEQRAARQAVADLQRKTSEISSTFANYLKHTTEDQVFGSPVVPEQIAGEIQDLVGDSWEINSLLQKCTGLGGDTHAIFHNTVVQIWRLKAELVRRNAVVVENDPTITTMVLRD
jgi:hypothetical protein